MVDGLVDASFDVGGVDPGFDLLVSLFVDCSGKNGGSCGAVSGLIVGLVGDGLDEGRSDVGGPIRKFNSFGDSDTVFGDFW